MLAGCTIWALHSQQLTTQAKPNATGRDRNRALYQRNGDLTVLEETFGAAASKAPFFQEKEMEVLWKKTKDLGAI